VVVAYACAIAHAQEQVNHRFAETCNASALSIESRHDDIGDKPAVRRFSKRHAYRLNHQRYDEQNAGLLVPI